MCFYFLWHVVSWEQIPRFFCCLCFCALAIKRQEINKESGDSSPALLFIELKASGMTGITNSANHAVDLFSVCIKEQLSLLSVSLTTG